MSLCIRILQICTTDGATSSRLLLSVNHPFFVKSLLANTCVNSTLKTLNYCVDYDGYQRHCSFVNTVHKLNLTILLSYLNLKMYYDQSSNHPILQRSTEQQAHRQDILKYLWPTIV